MHRAHALKERFKIRRAELMQNQNDARTAAQIDVEPRDVARFAVAEDAAILDAHIRKPQLFDLIANETFQSQQAGNDKFQHNNAPEKMI